MQVSGAEVMFFTIQREKTAPQRKKLQGCYNASKLSDVCS
jgi:hypothetical protein